MDVISILSLIIGILGLLYAIYSARILTKGIKVTALLRIRLLINRMEEEKNKHKENSPQWSAMHHSQQELDSLFKGLQEMFNISDQNAPLN